MWAMADTATIAGWGTLTIFNVAVIKILQLVFSKADLKEALREKDPDVVEASLKIAQAQAAAAPAPAPAAGGAVGAGPTPVVQPATSYSRVAGFIGAIVLACFIWALGNITIFKAFTNPTDISTILGSVGNLFLAGASLFAP